MLNCRALRPRGTSRGARDGVLPFVRVPASPTGTPIRLWPGGEPARGRRRGCRAGSGVRRPRQPHAIHVDHPSPCRFPYLDSGPDGNKFNRARSLDDLRGDAYGRRLVCRILTVANRTLGETLPDIVRRRIREGPCEFWVIVTPSPRRRVRPPDAAPAARGYRQLAFSVDAGSCLRVTGAPGQPQRLG